MFTFPFIQRTIQAWRCGWLREVPLTGSHGNTLFTLLGMRKNTLITDTVSSILAYFHIA